VTPLIFLAIIGLLVAFIVTFLIMPYVIRSMKRRGIIGVDVHKINKPEIAEMGGLGILFGVTVAGLVLFLGSGLIGFGLFDFRILVFLAVLLIAGFIGVIDDLKSLGPKVKPILSMLACLPIILYTWILGPTLGLIPPLLPAYVPAPYLPFLGVTRLTIVYPLILIPLAIAITSNAVNMSDVFNGVMPLTTTIMFVALLIVSLFMMAVGIPEAGLGLMFCSVMIGSLLAYYYYNRNPARVFAGDTGSLLVGAAIGAVAIMGRLEIIAIVALLPAIMNAFYSLVSIGGLLERRQMRARPTVFQEDGTLSASSNPKAPITLTRLIVARGSLTEQQITLSLATLTFASSVLAILTVFLIPYSPGAILSWPFSLLLVIIPLCLIFGVYLVLRKIDQLGIRLAGLVAIMVGVWGIGMPVFALLDYLIIYYPSFLWPIVGIVFVFGWLALWHFSTRFYFRYEIKKSVGITQSGS
jgi:UDP-N-acetylglucosamine--dolichyl-phosphate N-acetylglucosaminephosphotransferase